MISGAISPVPAPAASISHLSQRRGLHLSLNYSSGGFSKPWLASGAQNSVFFSARANGYTSKVFAAPQPPNPKKEDKLVTEGLITELLPNCMFRVRLENGEIILGYVSGKMRTKMVRVLVGIESESRSADMILPEAVLFIGSAARTPRNRICD